MINLARTILDILTETGGAPVIEFDRDRRLLIIGWRSGDQESVTRFKETDVDGSRITEERLANAFIDANTNLQYEMGLN